MGIGVLRGAIGLDGSECPGQLNDIHVLSSFGYESYVRVVKDLFESHRKYLEGSCDDKGDIETENEMITQSITDLCDILVKPKATKKGDKSAGKFTSKLSKVKLRILLDKHSLKQTSQFVLDFVRHVQELVSQYILIYATEQSAENIIRLCTLSTGMPLSSTLFTNIRKIILAPILQMTSTC